jgi:hypothetical protein
MYRRLRTAGRFGSSICLSGNLYLLGHTGDRLRYSEPIRPVTVIGGIAPVRATIGARLHTMESGLQRNRSSTVATRASSWPNR